MRVYISLIVLLVHAMAVDAQHVRLSRAAIDSMRNPKMLSGGARILRFPQTRLDLGTMYDSDTAHIAEFVYSNVSTLPVVITKVTTSCGCTVPEFDTMPIAPAARSAIKIAFSPKGKDGTVDTDVFVYTALSAKQPVAHLVLTANVLCSDAWRHLPCKMGSLRLKRRLVEFAADSPRGRIEERIACANTGVEPLELSSAMLPRYATLHTEPGVLAPGEEGDIVITVDYNMLPNAENGEIRLGIVLDNIESRPSARTIDCVIKTKKQSK